MFNRIYIVIVSLCLCTSMYAVDDEYHLLRLGTEVAQPMTQEEIFNSLSIEDGDLYKYRCDNPERYETFGLDFNFTNSKKDSLRVLGQDGKKYIYKYKSLIDEKSRKKYKVEDFINYDTMRVKGYQFTYLAFDSLNQLMSKKMGKKLITRMQKSPKIFYIVLGGNNVRGFDSRLSIEERAETQNKVRDQIANFQAISLIDDKVSGVKGIIFDSIGGYGTIKFNPQMKFSFINTKYELSGTEGHQILAHEMYHAYDGARGLLDLRRVVYNQQVEGQPIDEVSEYRAVRFANLLRKKNMRRRFYTKPENRSIKELKSYKSMLDRNDEPVVMPTPCIRWL